MNDKQRARLDRLTLSNKKLEKQGEELRKEVELAKTALKEIQERQRQRGMRMKAHEQLQKLGVLVLPDSDER